MVMFPGSSECGEIIPEAQILKIKSILFSTVVVVSLFLVACSPAEQPSLAVSCDRFMEVKHITREIDVSAGDTFSVTLCSNPTTGFQWSHFAQISNQSVLEQTDHQFSLPENGNQPPAIGAPGQEIWTFKALKKGTGTVSMEYSRPWAGGEKGEWTFVLNVSVK